MEVIDYTEKLSEIEQELINIRELQINAINNTVEFANVLLICIFFLIAVILGLYIIKVAFRQ